MNDVLKMVVRPGYVLVGPNGLDHCVGFEFDYKDDRFDGCRMGQMLPLLWAQKVIADKIAKVIAEPDAHGVEDCAFQYDDMEEMGQGFASMLLHTLMQSGVELGTDEIDDFYIGFKNSFENFNDRYRYERQEINGE